MTARVHGAAIMTAAMTARTHAVAVAVAAVAVTVAAIAIAIEVNTIASASDRTICTRAGTAYTATYTASHTGRGTVHVMSTQSSAPDWAAIGVEPSMMIVAAVTATIGNPHAGTAEVKIVAIVIAIDREEPAACPPHDGTEEIVRCKQQAVLPVVQDAAEIVDSVVVIDTIKVGRRVDTEEVVEVDLVGIVILLVVEVEFIRHLVRQVESLGLSTFETHCMGTHPGCHHEH